MRQSGIKALIVVTVVALIMAGLSLWRQQNHATSPDVGQTLFPNLAAHEKDIARIEVTTAQGTTILLRQKDDWVLPDKSGYKADTGKVSQVISTLANMNLLEEKTSDPGRYAQLGLDDPGKDKQTGAGKRIRLLDGAGTPIAEAIIGRTAPSLGRVGGGTYVRRAGSPQTWLAEGLFEMPETAIAWTDRKLFPGNDPGQIKTVTLATSGKASITVTRDKADSETFTLQPAAPGKPDQGKMLALAAMPTTLTFDDVRPVSQDQPRTTRSITFQEFDATKYRLDLILLNKDLWVAASEESGKDLQAYNAVHAGWLYKLPGYRSALLQSTLPDFVEKTDTSAADVAHPKALHP